ncbi:response regulator [Galbitalea soli]|uniref:Transcriptional regulatory protein n=2 Tax=Galbitalea soli TaxID=1268042 RepID=A0A7C9TTP1_9MICO|nr:response regulator [Galbitalea soli]NEM92342.1 response regulator [Galbitalea soli]
MTGAGGPVRVLVVDDDPVAAEAHAAYIARIDGCAVVGVAGTLAAAAHAIRRAAEMGDAGPIDLVLLDLTLPDGHGVDLVRRLRAAGLGVDIIAITAVRDLEVVRAALSVGIAQYLIKPFSFATFRAKIEAYLDYRRRSSVTGAFADQAEVDGMLASLRPASPAALPKGLTAETLAGVVAELRAAAEARSAAEVAESLGLSRVTARRYLEHLANAGRAGRAPRYGTPGRPELEYRWLN